MTVVRGGQLAGLFVLAAVTAVLLTPAVALAGPLIVVAPLAVLVGYGLVMRPAAALLALFVTMVLLEDITDQYLPVTAGWYRYLPLVKVQPTDFLLAALLGAVLIDATRTRRRLPLDTPFTLPLVLLAAATLGGFVTGFTGAPDLIVLGDSARILGYLVIIPFVVAYLFATRPDDVRLAVAVAAGLTAGKSLVGVVTWMAGLGFAFDGNRLIFFEPTMNFLMMVYLLGALAAVVARYRLPRWAALASPVVFACLMLSFRRSFWLATIAGFVVVLIVGTGRRGRVWVVLGGGLLMLGLWTMITVGGATDSQNVVVQRATSLSPTKVQTNSTDRYRLDEQRNVVAELKARPLTGLGLGVPWTARYPLSEEHEGGHFYTHVTFLWFWLKLGVLGAIAYVWLVAAALLSAYNAWRRASDALVRIAGLALLGGIVGLTLAETTGPFTGINLRMSVVMGCVFGWLAIASRPTGVERGSVMQINAARVDLVRVDGSG